MSIIEGRKTTSLVHFNTKIEAANIDHLDYGGVEIEEGRFIVETSGKAAKATAGLKGTGSSVVELNWLDTEAGSVKDQQVDAFDETAPTITQGSGGLAGIIGSGLLLGIHKKHWDVNTNYDVAAQQVVAVGSDGKPKNFELAGGNPIEQDRPYFGVIFRVREDVVWFIFESVGQFLGS